jgi:short-subunit dehydrogenase involved in D-alanine esterification of teichoic acids
MLPLTSSAKSPVSSGLAIVPKHDVGNYCATSTLGAHLVVHLYPSEIEL